MTPCSTLEQRWSACRARGYGTPWFGDWEPSKACVLGWLHEQKQAHRRPCTSPRRQQCRRGAIMCPALGLIWVESARHQYQCQGDA
jgi:hypothetical protein